MAIDSGYECHSCGASFAAGLVRVPRAFGADGRPLADAAWLPIDLPETVIVDEATLDAQNVALAAALPRLPVVLGGCCCAHVGAVAGLRERTAALGVVWVDAHGDLNTPETSPSGNEWGMPLRMLLDAGTIPVGRCALVGARSLDPPERQYLADTGLPLDEPGVDAVLAAADAVYVAFDADVLDPAQPVEVFVPEPGGLDLADAEALLERIAALRPIAGAGFTGLTPAPRNAAVVERLLGALGLG